LSGLIFSLLGRLQIEHRRLGAVALTNRKAIGLLAYLLIESDHAHSREFLLGLLWPDLPTAAAQNNLRVTWSHLQKALGASDADAQPYLIGDRLALRFNPLSDHELDVTRFRTLIETCRLNGVNTWECLLTLMGERAAARQNPAAYLPWNYTRGAPAAKEAAAEARAA